MKLCRQCHEEKPLGSFYTCPDKPSGVSSWCKECTRRRTRQAKAAKAAVRPPRPSDEQRFWSKVNRGGGSDQCWEWSEAKNRRGYGKFWRNGSTLGTHRVAWELSNGSIPNGLFVCHHCDNPACCNPKHLFLGTLQDNVDDMVSKGRGSSGLSHAARIRAKVPRGECSWNAKLDSDSVLKIVESLRLGRSQYEIAAEFCVSQHTISSIATGKTWAHVTERASNSIPMKQSVGKDDPGST